MALQRTTTTVTEHYKDNDEKKMPDSTQGPGVSPTNLPFNKNNPTSTRSTGDLIDETIINNFTSYEDVDRFSKELNSWLGKHTFWIFGSMLSAVAIASVPFFNIATTIGQTQNQFESLKNLVTELKEDNKKNTERILKLEITSQNIKK
jgi:hypothetical protein